VLCLAFLECEVTEPPGERVTVARTEKDILLAALFKKKKLQYPPRDLFIRAFKAERLLEVWARNNSQEAYRLVKIYSVCARSGKLGPKFKEGDKQTPEGFYFINKFHQESIYYLALGLNYPNESDLIRADPVEPGSDIYIHGECFSLGCLAMTNNRIKEIYWLAWQAHSAGQEKIQVHIFPFKMHLKYNYKKFRRNRKLNKFWNNLKPGYYYFIKHRQPSHYRVNKWGFYVYY
jgi:murein L,D-transpeptidase YafK